MLAAADVVLIDKPGNCAFNRVYCACVDVEITQDCMVLQSLCVCFQANCYISTWFASPKCNFFAVPSSVPNACSIIHERCIISTVRSGPEFSHKYLID